MIYHGCRTTAASRAHGRNWFKMHLRFFFPGLAAMVLAACAGEEWPRPDSYEGLPSISALKLVQSREDHASKVPLGSTEDVREIRSLVIRNMRSPDATDADINKISWLSQAEVIVDSSWGSAPIDYPFCIYVLQKKDKSWKIVTRYLLAGA